MLKNPFLDRIGLLFCFKISFVDVSLRQAEAHLLGQGCYLIDIVLALGTECERYELIIPVKCLVNAM